MTSLLLGIGMKALVSAAKLWKTQADKQQADALEEVLRQHEAGKLLEQKVATSLASSLQTVALRGTALETFRRLIGDELFARELAISLAAGHLAPAELSDGLIRQDASLAENREELLSLATIWCNAIYTTIGEIPALAHALQLQSQHRTETAVSHAAVKLDALTTSVAAASETQAVGLGDIKASVEALVGQVARLPITLAEVASGTQPALRSRFQQRFDKLRDELIHGSVRAAQDGYSELIEDLKAAASIADRDLLFRSYLNYSSALIESGLSEESADAIREAEKLSSTDLRLKRHQAVWLSHEGRSSEALAIVQGLRAIEPDNPQHLLNEAALLFALDRVEELFAFLEDHRLEDADYYCLVAHTALRRGNIESAEAAARRACELDDQNERAWMALGYSLGFPVIEKRQGPEPKVFWVDVEEIAVLRAAIEAVERAAAILKRRERIDARAEALGNALAFYAALGEDDKALAIGKELWSEGARSELTLRNMFYLQMRNGKCEEALETAGAMIEAGLSEEGLFRRAQALVAMGQFEIVLTEWDKVIRDAGPLGPPDEWIELASHAWCAAQQRERALEILDQWIEARPSSADLILERASVLEELGRNDLADAAFIRAETLAPDSAQVAADYGAFLYRQSRWGEAIKRFDCVGAASVASPIFQRYLIAVFNSGNIGRCEDLVALWMQSGNQFDHSVFALGARCAVMTNDFPRARSFLEELLRRGQGPELEHRKMLGQVYLRLDEQEQAYNLLAKAVSEQPDDAEALMLLATVCTARGMHEEALRHGRRAADLAPPDNPQPRAAFFAAMLALPPGFTPPADFIEAHHANITALTEHPSGILRAVKVTPVLGGMRELLEEKEQQVERVMQVAKETPVPMGFPATQTGTSLYDAWRGSIRNPAEVIRMSVGSIEAQQEELRHAAHGDSVTLDLLALFTLQGLGLLNVLTSRFKRIFAHISLLHAVIENLRMLRDHPGSGRMGLHKGHFFLEESSPEQEREMRNELTAIREFLKNAPVELVGLRSESIQDKRLTQIAEACASPSVLPMLVAKERSTMLLSDDLVIRRMAGDAAIGVRGFCSQALLRNARDSGALASDEYQDALLRLIEWGYIFVGEESGTLERLFLRTSGPPTPLANSIIRRIEDPSINAITCVRILCEFVAFLWGLGDSTLKAYRETWATAVWRAVLKAPKSEIFDLFVSALAVPFKARPNQFITAIRTALQQIPELREMRVRVLAQALRVCDAFAGDDEGQLTLSEANRREWAEQRETLHLLTKIGGA